MKNPTIATLLNFIPGLGYIYIGGKRRILGIALLIAVILTFLVPAFDPIYADTVYGDNASTFKIIDLFYLLTFVLFVGGFMYDGYVCANEFNKNSKQKK